jgi:hypothetical protein
MAFRIKPDSFENQKSEFTFCLHYRSVLIVLFDDIPFRLEFFRLKKEAHEKYI